MKIFTILFAMCCMSSSIFGAAASISFSDDFSGTDGKPSGSWEIISGTFPVAEGKLSVRADRGSAFAVIRDVPELETFEYSVRFSIMERVNASGWVTAGVMLYQDGANHWRLQFVEGPDKKRYFEMGETLAGIWQAHSSGPNKLRSADVSAGTWEYGKEYLMKLSLTTNGIYGEISDTSAGKTVARYRYFWDSARAVQMGRPGITANGFAASYARARVTAERIMEAPAGITIEDGKGRCAVLSSGDPDSTARIAAITKTARGAGFGVTVLTCDDIIRPKVLRPENFDIFILPDTSFPAPARDIVLRYFRNGGNAVMLGGRAFESLLYPVDGKWLKKQDLERTIAATEPSSVLFSFSGDTSVWERSSDKKDNLSTATSESGSLHIDIKGYTLWDTFATTLPRKLAKNESLIIVSMKGDASTSQVAVELNEQDGSRWIAVTDITPEMKRYVLLPAYFKAWDTKAKEKAGIDMERVEKISIGLAGSHTTRVSRGDHSIWIDAIGVAENHFRGIDLSATISIPVFGEDDDSALTGVIAARHVKSSPFASDEKIAVPMKGLSAVGFGIPNESVSVPLMEAVDAHGRNRGYAAGMLMHIGGGYRGSTWLYSGITGDAFYTAPAFAAFLAKALRSMKSGELLKKAAVEDQTRPKGLALTAAAPKGFVHIKDGHFAYPDGRRMFITGCNYIGSFATAVRFCQDENFDPREIENNFRMARDAGVNVMRLFHVHGLVDGIMKGDRRKLDTILELARRYGVYLLVETSAGLSDTGGDMNDVCNILTHVADALKDEPMVFGYDLRNEPPVSYIAGRNFPAGNKPAIHTTRLIDLYPDDAADIKKIIETRPSWLRLSSAVTGSDAENAIAAIYLWNKYSREYNISSTTFGALPATGLPTPPKWEPLVKAVDQSYGLWIQMQKDAVRKADPNHLISVGYNQVFAALPCNDKLDFVSHHVYGKPFSYAEVIENITTMDRLKKLFPSQPVSLGEFGYSTGISMPGSGNLDPYTASVGEMIHYLYAFANGYEGCKKWMLVDWPLAVMYRFGSWGQHGIEGKRYEARFGIYAYDGTAHGKPKPIAYALKFLRDYADTTAPSGGIAITEGTLTIGTVYEYTNSNALFVGNKTYKTDRLEFTAEEPVNVMLSWNKRILRIMASADARVTITPSGFGVNGQTVDGKHGGLKKDGKRVVIDMLEGETLTIR
ncbi:MAG: hypothetical protein HZC28_00265 [Spirochaetes bacterium]|nr:hypothetical protein [Spirochaetota bacterium]